jgi:tetratricopeptide (TPR) repeat protein
MKKRTSAAIFVFTHLALCAVILAAMGVTASSQEIDRTKKGKYTGAVADFKNDLWMKNYFSAMESYTKGAEQYQNKDYPEAEKYFKEALDILPEFAEAGFFVGMCRYNMGEFEKALTGFEEAKGKYPVWTATIKKIQQDDYDRMSSRLEELRFWKQDVMNTMGDYRSQDMTNTPSYSNLSNQLAFIDSEISKLEGLKGSLSIDAGETIPAKYYFHAGNCLLKLEKFDKALEQYEKAIEVDQNFGQAYHNIAAILFMAKEYEDAWLYLQSAKQLGAEINAELEKKLNEALMSKVKQEDVH